MSRFHSLKIKDIRRETVDAISIAFDIPEDLVPSFTYEPGQYLTLRAKIGDNETRRSYSICSGLDDGEIRVAIKRVEGGLFSTFANENLAPGMALDVMPPEGRFTAPKEAAATRNYVAFAAGSGVTPVLSIMKSVLTREPESTFTFFYGNRDTGAIIFRETIEDLKDRFMDRLTVVHLLSREAQEVELLHGRLDGGRIRKLAEVNLFDPARADLFFLCGPGDMIDSAKSALNDLGVPADKIRFELFTPADGATARSVPSSRAGQAARNGVQVEAVLDGGRRQFEMEAGDGNVIDAAHRHGLELPYSCKGGMCCTCRCKVVEGEVEMAVNYSLEPWELEAGFVLACQSRPLTEKLVLDFDEV